MQALRRFARKCRHPIGTTTLDSSVALFQFKNGFINLGVPLRLIKMRTEKCSGGGGGKRRGNCVSSAVYSFGKPQMEFFSMPHVLSPRKM